MYSAILRGCRILLLDTLIPRKILAKELGFAKIMRVFIELLSKSKIGGCSMDFYCFPNYACHIPAMISAGYEDIAEMSDIDHIKLTFIN